MMDTTDLNGHDEAATFAPPSLEDAIHQLLAKVERIERVVDRLERVVDDTPALLNMGADTFDNLYAALQAGGVDVDQRARAGLHLLARLTEPDTARHLETLLNKVEALAGAAEEAPGLFAYAANALDDVARNAAQNGIDLDARLRTTLALVERLTAPDTSRVLTKLIDNLDKLETLLDDGPKLVAAAADTLDGMYAAALAAGINGEQLVRDGIRAAGRLTDLLHSEEFHALMDSGMLSPETLTVLGCAANAIATSRQHIEPMGPVAAIRALADPDTQRAIGFLTAFASKFGENLDGTAPCE